MKKINSVSLSKEEQDILDDFENNALVSVSNIKKRKKDLKQAAEDYFLTQKINMRISKNDLQDIKRMAANEGMEYQPFIRSILHKYAKGYLNKF